MSYSNNQSQQEVNDILSSIRQIISDEKTEVNESSQATSGISSLSDQVLDLTKLVQEDGSIVQLSTPSDQNLPFHDSSKSNDDVKNQQGFSNAAKDKGSIMDFLEEKSAQSYQEFSPKETSSLTSQFENSQNSNDLAPTNDESVVQLSSIAQQTPSFSNMPQDLSRDDSKPLSQNDFLSAHTLQESAAAFAALSRAKEKNLAPDHSTPPTATTVANYTVDSLMRELLKPLLKEWLDAHLPSLVKALVLEQIEKVLQQQSS